MKKIKNFYWVNRNICGPYEKTPLSKIFNSYYKEDILKYEKNNKYRAKQNRTNTNKERS